MVVPMERFWVAGRPRPQGSKRGFATKYGKVAMVEMSSELGNWRAFISAMAQAHMGNRPPIEGAVALGLLFTFQRPLADRKKVREHTGRPDLSKLVRAVEDALTGIVFTDDSRVVEIVTAKQYGERPGVLVIVGPSGKWETLFAEVRNAQGSVTAGLSGVGSGSQLEGGAGNQDRDDPAALREPEPATRNR